MSAPVQVVILGASGDLTLRKLMPALAGLAAGTRAPDDLSVLGVARRPKTDEQFREEVRGVMPPDLRDSFEKMAARVAYQRADVGNREDLEALAARLDSLPGGAGAGRLFYLALGPALFGPTVQGLAAVGLLEMLPHETVAFRRIVVEKPFGHDLESARALNRVLHHELRERQVYRIDHYLGKETVQNLLGFRFHNAIFEPLWNRHHVELVQITVAESIGVEQGRAGYYDQVGAVRDMLQNHMLQVLSLVAMEPPSSLDSEAIRDMKVGVLRGLRCPDAEDIARTSVRARYVGGQIDDQPVVGYREEQGVPPDSDTETYVAVRAEIDNWRWTGVPFLLRHGKRMPQKMTQVCVQFRTPPLQLFNRPEGMPSAEFGRLLRDGSLCQIRPNVLTLNIQPRESISLGFGVKRPGSAMIMAPTEMTFDYRDHFGEATAPAYERLLLDAIQGDPTLFLRADEIEMSWRYTDRVLGLWKDSKVPLREYPAGSWGPPEADELFFGCEGGWSRG